VRELLVRRIGGRARGLDLALILGGSLLVALSAQPRFDLPFSPVPITLQTLAVMLVGATLGARGGAAALALYLAEGLAGLPVFAGGASGIPYALGPTGGYLIGFIASAALVGAIVERWGRDPLRVLAAFILGSATVYLFGVPWLALTIGPDRAIAAGLLPYIPGDLVKSVLGAAAWLGIGRVNRR